MTKHVNFDISKEEFDWLEAARKRLPGAEDINEFKTADGQKITKRNKATWRFAIVYWAKKSSKYDMLLKKYTDLMEENEQLKNAAEISGDRTKRRLVVV